MKLYEIVDSLLQLYEMADTGQVDPQAITDTLDLLEWELEEKADNYAKLITSLKGEIEAIKTEEKRLASRRKAKEAVITTLTANLKQAMEAADKPKIKTPLHSFTIQKNPPSVSITDIEYIPKKYFIKPEPVLDKQWVKDELKAGEIIPGVELTQTESLRIR